MEAGNGGSVPVRIKEAVKAALGRRRPWNEIAGNGFDSFSRPRNLRETFSRSRANILHFRGNYASILLVMSLYGLIGEPTSLAIVFMLAVLWHYLFFFRSGNPSFLGVSFSEGVVLAVLVLVTVAAVYLTGIWWNLLCSIQIGAPLVAIHAVFRDPSDLFLDEEAAARSGVVSASNSARV